MVNIEEYRKETIDLIKSASPILASKSDMAITEMYSYWSQINYSASWLMHNNRGIAAFIKWATTSPCDDYEDTN